MNKNRVSQIVTVAAFLAVIALLVIPAVAMADPGDIGANATSWLERNLNVTRVITMAGVLVLGYLMLRRMWSEFMKVAIGFVVWLAITTASVQSVLSAGVEKIVNAIVGK